MERIIYRKTLDVHKSGVQFTLQGFQTADNMSRTVELSLMASGDTIDLPLEQLVAVMYITTPNATEPSINECTIKDNTIVCDILPIVEEGITEVQLKLIDTRVEGANGVLATPKFAIEVSKSDMAEEGATQKTTFTALESALARAKGVYDARLLRIELDADCMFRAYYADGTVYESDVLKELFNKGDALISQSYAKGGTGVRAGEDTDNSMYYSQVSKSASMEVNSAIEKSDELLAEMRKHGVYTAFSVDFETGNVEYISPHYSFVIDAETGELEAIGEAYSPEDNIDDWLNEKTSEINQTLENNAAIHSELSEAIETEKTDRATNDESLQSAITENSNRIEELDTWKDNHEAETTETFNDINDRIETCNENITKNDKAASDNAAEIIRAFSYVDEINTRVTGVENNISATVESKDYPGCYYRMVGDEKEWVNPPMVTGESYRTTERFLGEAVYVKYFTFPTTAINASDTYQIIEIQHEIPDFYRRVRTTAIKGNGRVLPYHTIQPFGVVDITEVTETHVKLLCYNCILDEGTFGITLYYITKTE